MSSPFKLEPHELRTPNGLAAACRRAQRWLAHRGLSEPGAGAYMSPDREKARCAVGHLCLAAAQGEVEVAVHVEAGHRRRRDPVTARTVASWVMHTLVSDELARYAFEVGFDDGFTGTARRWKEENTQFYAAGHDLGVAWALAWRERGVTRLLP